MSEQKNLGADLSLSPSPERGRGDPTLANMAPCPFCGGQPDQIRANGGTWNGGMRPPQPPVSYDVTHWCPRVEGQPSPRVIQRCGKTEADAIAAWNTRTGGVKLPEAAATSCVDSQSEEAEAANGPSQKDHPNGL